MEAVLMMVALVLMLVSYIQYKVIRLFVVCGLVVCLNMLAVLAYLAGNFYLAGLWMLATTIWFVLVNSK